MWVAEVADNLHLDIPLRRDPSTRYRDMQGDELVMLVDGHPETVVD